MIEPLPNCFSMFAIAMSIARFRSARSSAIGMYPFLSEVPQERSLYQTKNQLPKSIVGGRVPGANRFLSARCPDFTTPRATRWHGGCTNALQLQKETGGRAASPCKRCSKVLETNELDSRLTR